MRRTRLACLASMMSIGMGFGPAGCGDTAGTSDGGADMATGTDGGTCQPAAPDPKCPHATTDYEPRVCMSEKDTWAACVSDKGTFTLIGMSAPPSASRTMAFDQMAPKLWANPSAPTKDDFLAARDLYTIPNGIASRVERRQDVTWPELPGDDKLACSDMMIAKMYPDRCAGPGRLLPIINDAFTKGINGTDPRIQAARIEAALVWFFYISTTSEVWTCSFDDIEDCDAAWGYFNGAQPRESPMGIGKYFKGLDDETYQRSFDAILGERCWRDLDKDMPAKRMDLMKLATDQLIKAEIRGEALVLKDRFTKLAAATGEVQAAHLAFINTLGPLLDHQARMINAAKADALKAQWSATSADKVDAAAAKSAIDALFPCP